MLELKKITKSYSIGENSQQVLKGIDVTFRKCEFVSILGSSGSGKTTLLNIIGGLDRYDSGDVIIEGISTKKYTDRDWDSYRNYRVGFIFQSYNLIMHQSVLQNVEIALTLSGVSKHERRKRAIDALTRVGLKDHIYKKPNQLSGGQMQRVAIARALVNDPEIILADEPTGALDSITSTQIMDLLKEIASDKLVIMVTHNPNLAKEYSNRIIELKDGIIINDSNPFTGDEEISKEKKMNKTSMSLASALSLSFNNLLKKKGRTFLTAFAGSIGIIGIALILSLSNGVNKYAKSLEKDSLSEYPITIERTSYDLFGSISTAINDLNSQEKCEDGKICSKDDIIESFNISDNGGLEIKNNLVELKKYIDTEKGFQENASNIVYNYNLDLQVYTNDYLKVNPSAILGNRENNLFNELENDENKFEILSGHLPKDYHEVVLIVGENNAISDSLLYSLGIKDRKDLANDLKEIRKDENYQVKSSTYSYQDFLDKRYKVILNTDYYREQNGTFIDSTNDIDYMKSMIDNGIEIKIVGVLKDKNTTSSSIGYQHDLTMQIIDKISKTSIYKKQIANKDINILTGMEFDGIINTYDNLAQQLGIFEEENPSSISIYPKDYNSKEKIIQLIDQYNEDKKAKHEDDLVVTYSDLMKSLVSGVTKAVNIVSYVLIAFVAISLIVSSIMIAIITYISVLERTKEIGILRAIGASKKDIKRVFRAETMIEGFVAGALGIGIAFLLDLAVNGIVGIFNSEFNHIASMPIGSAITLILLSIVLNVIAGSKPASMAAKKDPVESLRTE